MNLIHFCLKRLVGASVSVLRTRCVHWTKPLTSSLPLGTLADLARSKAELMAENALLRQQLIILKRQVKRPACTKRDRILLVLLARAVRAWKQTLFIIQPETLLRWHRELFRLYWKRRSKASSHKPKVAAETIAMIREMAKANRLWGAERIRGELLKLGVHVCKRTIQKYMRNVRTPQPRGQKWRTFLHNHAAQIWACDFLPGLLRQSAPRSASWRRGTPPGTSRSSAGRPRRADSWRAGDGRLGRNGSRTAGETCRPLPPSRAGSGTPRQSERPPACCLPPTCDSSSLLTLRGGTSARCPRLAERNRSLRRERRRARDWSRRPIFLGQARSQSNQGQDGGPLRESGGPHHSQAASPAVKTQLD